MEGAKICKSNCFSLFTRAIQIFKLAFKFLAQFKLNSGLACAIVQRDTSSPNVPSTDSTAQIQKVSFRAVKPGQLGLHCGRARARRHARVGATRRRDTSSRPGFLRAPGAAVNRPPAPQAGASVGGATQGAWRTSAPTEPDPCYRARPPR
jgi:hypothetical protein